MNLYRPIIIGIAGYALTESEQSWLTELKPYGVILFSRNIDNPSQLKALCASLRQILGDDVVIVIDQEGGRVQRLKQPDWPQLPAALDIGKLWRKHQFKGLEAANSLGQVIGSQLASVGISHVAAPVLDLSIDGADPVIGDRAFGTTPAEVIPLATAFIDGVTRSGVTPIVKHIPGMGRADMDSHQSLPILKTTCCSSRAIGLDSVSGRIRNAMGDDCTHCHPRMGSSANHNVSKSDEPYSIVIWRSNHCFGLFNDGSHYRGDRGPDSTDARCRR
jgi:beta-N-acetylhexosaminidase